MFQLKTERESEIKSAEIGGVAVQSNLLSITVNTRYLRNLSNRPERQALFGFATFCVPSAATVVGEQLN